MREIQPWWVRSHPLQKRTGADVFVALFGHFLTAPSGLNTTVVLLESPCPENDLSTASPNARFSICAGPPRWQGNAPRLWTPSTGNILPTLSQLLQASSEPLLTGEEAAAALDTLPFAGGWLGWLGYDLAWEIEQLPHLKEDTLPFATALWYEPQQFAVVDHQARRLWLMASQAEDLDDMEQRLQAPPTLELDGRGATLTGAPHFHMAQTDYEAAVLKAQQYIQAGDIFQANLSLRFETQTLAHSWSLYQRLQKINPSPFACYWHTLWGSVISCSPERLVQLRGHHAQTRPIAGTRPRGSTPEEDQNYAQTLLANPKENAEHIMLVDLERNDLGRVCDWGSVIVDELLTLESYSHVMHLVSNVSGTLKADCDGVDLIRATFPGGTITGCPKVRCLEIIEELEPVRRSLFYGSCGYLDGRGNLDLNILIRTLLAEVPYEDPSQPRRVWGQVGAGIVADSDPEREWQESLQKAKAQLLALEGHQE